jgi:hypothetical protein
MPREDRFSRLAAIKPPSLSDEAVVEIYELIGDSITWFQRHYREQLQRYYFDPQHAANVDAKRSSAQPDDPF